MSTRSIIAAAFDGDVRGRYVHWDGYPTGVGAAVSRIVRRDGYEQAVRTLLIEHHGWSSVTGADEQALHEWDSPARFVPVPGYGIAYTDAEQPDEWLRPGDDSWCEWVYTITPSRLVVSTVTLAGGWTLAGHLDWSAQPDAWATTLVRISEERR